jgi:hypothetical protein
MPIYHGMFHILTDFGRTTVTDSHWHWDSTVWQKCHHYQTSAKSSPLESIGFSTNTNSANVRCSFPSESSLTTMSTGGQESDEDRSQNEDQHSRKNRLSISLALGRRKKRK